MNRDLQESNEKHVVHGHETSASQPHTGHGGTSFEGTDAKAGLVIWSLAIIWGTLIFVFAITVGIQKYLEVSNPPGHLPSPLSPDRVLPPAPQLQVHPWEELPDIREQEEKILNSYGKDPDGRVHIPINQAMDAIVARLKIQPGAPQGITVPGGQGRDFAASVNAMPAPYRTPQIQGEIHKNAQK